MRRTIALRFLASVLLFAACSSDDTGVVADGGSPVPGGGPTPLLVSIELGGGFVPVGADFRNLPSAVIYADGSTFSPGATTAIYPGPAVLPVVEGRIDGDALARILEAADEHGLLADEPLDGGDPPIADAPTTTITVVVDGEEHVTSIYALAPVGGIGEEQPGVEPHQQDDRRAAQAFVDLVSELVTNAESDTYDIDRYRVFPLEPGPVEDGIEPDDVEWPLDDVELELRACTPVAGEQAEALESVLEGASQITRWHTGDGGAFELVVRPVLPHEPDCPDAG